MKRKLVKPVLRKRMYDYWCEDLQDSASSKPKKKDKCETFDDDDDDDVDSHLPLSQEYMDHFADILEQFLQISKTYFIYPELSKEQYKMARKVIKKAVSRMRKGKTNDFDEERTMGAIVNGDIPEKYIDGNR